MAIDFHLIWREQCNAARGLKDRCGTEKALGYLIGEKLMNFVRAADDAEPNFAGELPRFVAEVREIFSRKELRSYLDTVSRIGSLGHICSDDEQEFFRAHGAIDENPVRGADDVLVMHRIREMLLQ
jgi:hypothetical protein